MAGWVDRCLVGAIGETEGCDCDALLSLALATFMAERNSRGDDVLQLLGCSRSFKTCKVTREQVQENVIFVGHKRNTRVVVVDKDQRTKREGCI